ncbi:MAG: tetratricopeptide repeat protein [Candidatus Marinimicrobia bacterium]|nr:tetratricopeptide repeat protein [Candidatus Neomarinimicrobiota bacterium]
MSIEYGGHDLLQKGEAYEKQSYVPYEYYESVIEPVQGGHQLARMGRYPEALERFYQALGEDSSYVFAHNGLANVYMNLKDYGKAEFHFRKAMQFGPDYAFPYNNLANLYMSRGDYDEARPLLQKALKLDPNSSYIYYNLGNLYLAEGNTNLAQSHYLKALKLRKDFCNARYNLALTYARQGQDARVIEEYERVVKDCPGHEKAVLNLAAYYAESNEIEKALILYRQAVVVNPTAKLYLALGHVYHNEAYFSREIEAYENAVRLDTSNTEAKYYLALAYYEQDMTFSARRLTRDILEKDPDNEEAWELLEKLGE